MNRTWSDLSRAERAEMQPITAAIMRRENGLGPIQPVGLPTDQAARASRLHRLRERLDGLTERAAWGGLPWDAPEADAKEYAEHQAERAERVLLRHGAQTGDTGPLWFGKLCAEMRINNPLTFWGYFDSDAHQETAANLDRILRRHDLDPAELRREDTEADAHLILVGLQKACDSRWWFRQWRKAQARRVDEIARALGQVRKGLSPYCANATVEHWRRQQRAARAFLGDMEAVNEDGDALNLADLADASLANPSLRRAELMTRLRGFEIHARAKGWRAEFWTLTCPSRFHPNRPRKRGNTDGSDQDTNPKWLDAGRPTVRDAQRYLCGVWSRIRSAADRAGIPLFGFRIAEPHADGCPHWHLLVWLPASAASRFATSEDRKLEGERDKRRPIPCRRLIRRPRRSSVLLGPLAQLGRTHALTDCPTEPGAEARRFDVEPIRGGTNPATGELYSAVGYVAKYISKNLDGVFRKPGEVPEDSCAVSDYTGGGSIFDNAERVRAWASVHGVRQFQQFGGPPVGVWRELRRLYNEPAAWAGDAYLTDLFKVTEQDDKAEAWAAFCALYEGGDLVAALVNEVWEIEAPAPVAFEDLETGEVYRETERRPARGRYGLPIERITALDLNGREYQSRLERWTLRRRPPKAEPESPPDWRRLLPERPQAGTAWTRGNNCTGGGTRRPTINDQYDLNQWELELAAIKRRHSRQGVTT